MSMVAAASIVGAGMAQAGAEPHLKSGAVGIARLQTARLTAVNYEPTAVGSTGVGADACIAVLGFQEVNETPIVGGDGRPTARQFSLMPKDVATLDLRSADVFARSSRFRSSFLASVRLLPEACLVAGTGELPPPGSCRVPPDACRNVVVTLEVFEDMTGRTTVFLGHSSFVDDPALLPPPVGDSAPQ
jgi:hypothetical protein